MWRICLAPLSVVDHDALVNDVSIFFPCGASSSYTDSPSLRIQLATEL